MQGVQKFYRKISLMVSEFLKFRYHFDSMLRVYLVILLLCFAEAFFSANIYPADQYPVVVLSSRAIGPYDDAIKGFEEELKTKGYQPDYHHYDLQDMDQQNNSLEQLYTINPKMVLAVGTEAALFAKQNIRNLPIIFSAVLDPVESGLVASINSPQANITGVALKIDVQKQFETLKQILPQAKRIGMLYDVDRKTTLKKEADKAAENLGLELIAKPILSKKDVTRKLEEVLNEVDCLWAGVDTLVYNSQSARHILLMTLRNKVPFMAFSSHYVKAGALVALECDYEDIGKQTAQLAIKIFRGYEPSELVVQSPRKVRLITNKNTAEVIGVKIPGQFLEE